MEGWAGELRGVEMGGERLLLPAPFGEIMKLFLKLPFRVGFDTVSHNAYTWGTFLLEFFSKCTIKEVRPSWTYETQVS